MSGICFMGMDVNKVYAATSTVKESTFDDDTVVLGASITVSDGEARKWADESADAPSNPWTPIGYSSSKYFQRTFAGQGKTISGIYVDENVETTYTGLFGYTKDSVVLLNRFGKRGNHQGRGWYQQSS